MPIGVSLRLYDGSSAKTNLSGITALWWNDPAPMTFQSPNGRTELATTDADGDIELDISNISTLPVGGWGFLLLYKPATDYQDSLVFASRVQVTTITAIPPVLIPSTTDALIEQQRADLMALGLMENGGEMVAMEISDITPVEQVRSRFASLAGAL